MSVPGASLPPWFRALEKAVAANRADRASTWLSLATTRPAFCAAAAASACERPSATSSDGMDMRRWMVVSINRHADVSDRQDGWHIGV
jgi:hypothetical protein